MLEKLKQAIGQSPDVVVVIGRTGDGKSTVCNQLAQHCGSTSPPFEESSAACSHTHIPSWCYVNGVLVLDTPGLMDSQGIEKDEQNIKLIVEYASACRSIKGFILVVNEQASRFDDGMQNAVKLFVDSFGPMCLANMGIAFTRAYGMVSLDAARNQGNEISKLISARTGVPQVVLPVWQLDCHPEIIAAQYGLTDEKLHQLKAKTQTSLADLVRWARAKVPVDTSDAVIGEYEMRMKARKAAEEAEAQRKAAAEAERLRAIAAKQAEIQRQAAAEAERQRAIAIQQAEIQRQAAAAAERQRAIAIQQAEIQRQAAAAAECAAALAREEAAYRARYAASHQILGYGPHNWTYHGGHYNNWGKKTRNHGWNCVCGQHVSGGGNPGGTGCTAAPIWGYTLPPWEKR